MEAYKYEEPKAYEIRDDIEAERALQKIDEINAREQRIVETSRKWIKYYEDVIQDYTDKCSRERDYYLGPLRAYFEGLGPKAKRRGKTQETYDLPSGVLRLKYPAPKYVRDDERLLAWLKEQGKEEYIKTKVTETPDWASLKLTTTIHDGQVVNDDGQVVEGVKAEEQPPKFEVERRSWF